ncbi:hydrogen peroxide-inducible genes activator [Thalassococcus sp. S3]|uniref:hydrogen peroxide-inducible genes activator n=1 Tax=Thalassococcus sp. S3 TaxID=2017482 RepID=UPI0010242AFF|nr:hydrogen peroxide-inducible genes activator [Thalassococcus sp. S3]QBF30986.1 DNA-binding transcriptional regulator OxyR [Thalassococcus sp. S3]
MPTIQQLRYLVAVADTLHFRRAAEACNVTQPTLSVQLKELEQKLSVQLVERSRSRVILTPLGRRVVDKARDVLRDMNEIRAMAKAGQSLLEDTIKIGVIQSLGSYLLPLIVPDLHENHPDLRLYVREELPDRLVQSLEGGTLDLLFFPLPVPRADLVSAPIFREDLLVAAPHDHPIAELSKVDPQVLENEIIMTLEPGHKLYEQVRGFCDDYGAALSHDYEGTSLDTLRQMVAMGMGLSLLPALYVKSEVAHQDIVIARPFKGRAPSRMIGMVWRRGTAREEEFQTLADLIRGILKVRASEITILN